jgi:hypothetical protein
VTHALATALRGVPRAHRGIGFEPSTRLGRNAEAIDIIKRCWTEAESFGYGADLGHPTGSPEPGFWKRWRAECDATLQRHGRTAAECPTSYFLTLFATRDPERGWAEHRQSFFHVARYYANVVGFGADVDEPETMPNWDKFFLTPR